MPVPVGHDLLAAYRGGPTRYLSFSGKILIWENRCVAEVQAAIGRCGACGRCSRGT